MNILNVSQNYFIQGGSDRYFFDLTEILEAKGHKVIPFCAKSERNESSRWESYFPNSANFEEPRLKDIISYCYNSEAATAMSRLLDEHHIDIVHLNIYYGKITSSILAEIKKRNIPIVQTLHEYKIVCPVYTRFRGGKSCSDCAGNNFFPAIKNRCNRSSFSRSVVSVLEAYSSVYFGSQTKIDRFVAISDYVKQSVVAMGVDEQKVETVHNFVNEFDSSVNSSVKSESYFLYAGRLEELKGVKTLLAAAMKLPSMRFKIAGHGPMQEFIEQQIESNGSKNIEFLGFLDKQSLQSVIRQSHACVVPSEWDEPFGLAVTEALACGVPVIGTRVGGITEIIKDGETGFLFDPGSVKDLADKLKKLADDIELRNKMSENAKLDVASRFTKEVYYQKLIALYENLINENS